MRSRISRGRTARVPGGRCEYAYDDGGDEEGGVIFMMKKRDMGRIRRTYLDQGKQPWWEGDHQC